MVEKGFDEKFGARPLRRAVERHLEDTLAESILNEEIEDSTKDLLIAKLKNDEVYFDATTDSRTPVPVSVDDKSSKNKRKQVVCIYLWSVKLTDIVNEQRLQYKIYCDMDGVLTDFSGDFLYKTCKDTWRN